jgi:hypothetical protein
MTKRLLFLFATLTLSFVTPGGWSAVASAKAEQGQPQQPQQPPITFRADVN